MAKKPKRITEVYTERTLSEIITLLEDRSDEYYWTYRNPKINIQFDKKTGEYVATVNLNPPLLAVDMIASGYDWECPYCDELNHEIEGTSYVDCKKCGLTSEVSELLDATS